MIDFFARRSHFIDHLAPIWKALDGERDAFYVPECLREYAEGKGLEVVPLRSPSVNDPIRVAPPGNNPLVVCAYGDLSLAEHRNPKRQFILQEHGVGITFAHPGYAGGLGLRRKVALFLAPNEFIRAKTAKALPDKPQVVIGTPKLDWVIDPLRPSGTSPKSSGFRGSSKKGKKPVVCISFHWNGSAVALEAGNAFTHYRSVLKELASQDSFTLIGHGHPRMIDWLAPYYEHAGIETVRDFDEVMRRADLYVNDCSSTLYEFLVTGRPVVILNAPWFRKNISRGIRFWDYTDVGPQVEGPEELLAAINEQLAKPGEFAPQRNNAVSDLFPYLGSSAERAAEALREFAL